MPRIPYGKIIRRTWRRENFKELGPIRRDLLSYLWTGPEGAGIPALYFITYGTMANDLGYSEKKIKSLLSDVIAAGFCKYDAKASIVFFPKQIKLDEPDHANVVIGWLKRMAELPESHLKNEFLECLQPYIAQWDITVEKYYKGSLKALLPTLPPQGGGSPQPSPQPSGEGPPNPPSVLILNHNHNLKPKERKEGSAAVAASPPALPEDESKKETGKVESQDFDPWKDFMDFAKNNKDKIYSNVLQKTHYSELGTADQLWSKIVWGTMVTWIRENREQARSALSARFKNSWIAYIDWWVRKDWLRQRSEIDKTRGMGLSEEKEHFRKKERERGSGDAAVLLGKILKQAKVGE